MASIIKRARKKGGFSWQAQIRLTGQKPVLQTFDNEQDARQFAELVEIKAKRNIANTKRAVKPCFLKESFRSVIQAYLASPDCADRDKWKLRSVCRNIDSLTTGEFDELAVEAYVKKILRKNTRRGKLFSKATIATHLSAMAKVYLWRARTLRINPPPHPFLRASLGKRWDVCRERRLERSEEISLIKRLRGEPNRHHWRLLMRLAIETGARQQELVLAEWKEFDIGRGLWRIPDHHTKSRTARVVSLSRQARRSLKILNRLRSQKNDRVFHCFKNAAGVSFKFHYMSREAGVLNFRFHDFRHEAISRMVLIKKTPPIIVMKMVGHSSLQMLTRYTNLGNEDLIGILD